MEQRYIPLNFSPENGVLEITAPINANIAPPGYYMLFIIDNTGVPSISKIMRLDDISQLPPVVDAGHDQNIILPASLSLDGMLTDDGLPNPPGILTSNWSKVSGPGSVIFDDSSAVDTTASFDTDGTYVLRLTADDGEFSEFDELTVTVNPEETSLTRLDIRISARRDDAEENTASGKITQGSSDLELAVEGSQPQLVGLRFKGLTIPVGSTISKAFIQFKVDELNSATANLKIEAQASNNAPPFTIINMNISSRERTVNSINWAPAPWTTIGETGTAQQTPDITSIIQELVDREGWSDGNSLVIIISGTGRRTAESYNGDANGAPILRVEYQ
jgi:hypothetical protein